MLLSDTTSHHVSRRQRTLELVGMGSDVAALRASGVTLGKVFTLTEVQFPYLKSGEREVGEG